MCKIIFLTNRDQLGGSVQSAYQDLMKQGLLCSTMQVAVETVVPSEVRHEKYNSQNMSAVNTVFIVSWMGSSQDPFIKEVSKQWSFQGIPYVITFTQPSELLMFKVMPAAWAKSIRDYLLYGGRENIRNLLLWLGEQFYAAPASWKKPVPLPWNGIFHPDADTVLSVDEYRKTYYVPGRATIGILFPRDAWVWGNLAAHALLVRAIEARGLNALAVFSHWTRDDRLQIPGTEDTVNRYFVWDGTTVVDAVIHVMWFSLTVGRPLHNPAFLQTLNVPIIHGATLLESPESWASSIAGLTPVELTANIVMPEFDGVIHGEPFAGRKKHIASGAIEYIPMPECIEMLVRRAEKWALLCRKANKDKKVAIIFHNYPPSDATIGTAIGLDSPRSVEQLLESMAEAGYDIGSGLLPDGDWLIEELTKQVTNDRNFLSDEKADTAVGNLKTTAYREWFATLPEKNRQQLVKDWGTPPGTVFNHEDGLLIPGMRRGNIFISVQPPRGFGEDPNKVYHSADAAPTHHYLAYYHWIRNVFAADAVIHVGTHGSLEWLPGKGAGLSGECYPAIAISDLPNIYPYLITVVCEGIQAKRRAAAVLIGHLPPPVTNADTYDELTDLENLLADYYHYKVNQPDQLVLAEKLIKEKLTTANLMSDIPPVEDEAFDSYLERVHGYINEIKDTNVRVGLHILGQAPGGEMLAEYLLAMTRVENGDTPSLRRVVADLLGYDYDVLCEERGKLLPDGVSTYGDILDKIRDYCREIIRVLLAEDFSVDATHKVLGLPWLEKREAALRETLVIVCNYICRELFPRLRQTKQELSNVLNALEGHYIEPGPAGAPTSGMADVLPTGRNFYGVDPRALPTQLAWEIGKQLGDALVERFLADEGHYPESIGMIFWSGNNMRTRGQCIAEFLYLMGVEPVWQKGSGRVIGLTVIPLEKLNRPRIDVTARISGMFRDSMPPAIDLLDQAVELVVDLEEPLEMNFIRKHVLEEQAVLEDQGLDQATAKEQACYRIFSGQPGTYGAGVGCLLENKNWQTVDDLGKVFVTWSAYAYTRKEQGKFVPESFSRRLASLEATVKNEDNYEVNMLDSDDFNAFHGGMIAAVRSLRGKAPRSYCGDASDTSRVALRSLQEETKLLFRSEVLNPKFIEGMKKHGYKGAADLGSIVAHSFEWDATSEIIEDWMYEGLARKYALDADTQQWMQEVNPWALQRITEKLLEASQRGLWQAEEQTKQELRELYLAIEGELEERGDD